MIRQASLIVVLLCLTLLNGCSREHVVLVKLGGNTMGTTYNVVYVQDDAVMARLEDKNLQAQIDQRLIEINQLMSTYISDSELSMLNKAQANEAFQISDETAFVLETALGLSKLSEGSLDVTVGPLVNLWGFGPDFKPNKSPSKEELESIKPYVGVDKFSLKSGAVTKAHESVYIDLSTIAKGYGVDQIAELLMRYGIDNYLVEIGGEMLVSGTKPNEQKWRIAVEKPISGERAIQKVLNLTNSAVATSGDYRNYFEENGKRYSHLIDPKSAQPIQHNLVSVTVVAETSIMADGLATALIVMGPEKGMQLAQKENIAALFISKEGDTFIESKSDAFIKKLDDR